ncbi:MAG: MoaD/ThiS family protein [Thermoplasmata archaeon]|nr:MoaD/ThiS family protein [Thermoplasmata archaeon]MCI4361697.1 MoaD/ThiS family protein [Thermoplasmata archaeon]MCI4370995.1 MoaD/ThiS family protein [Thermoplasmata archaeon]
MRGVVQVRLYATAREAAGIATIHRPTGPDGVVLRTLLRELASNRPQLALVFRHARFARNGTYLRGLGARLHAGDELAVHPPYSGG